MRTPIGEKALRALAGLMFGVTLAAVLLGAQEAQAQSAGEVIAGPYTVQLPSTQLFSFSRSFSVSQPIQGSYVVRLELNPADSLTSLSVNLNGAQVFALSDFAGGVTSVDKVVTLLASNTIAVQVAGATGTRLTITVFTVVMPQPVSLTPNPLALNAGASGTLTATLSPAPTAAGTLGLTSSNAGIASVPVSVDFASGQTSVAIPVNATAAGSATVTASANGGQATATVNVNALPTVSLTAPAAGAVFTAPAEITLTAEAADADGTIASVEFFAGANLIASRTAAPYSFLWTGVAAGSYGLTARATDNLGATATSAAVSVTVNTGVAQMYFIHADHVNTPRKIYDQNQQLVWSWDQQEPFGDTPPDENPSGLGAFEFPLRFSGTYADRESAKLYNYFRDALDPALGRYTQFDPIGLRGGINGFVHVSNNPLSFTDPFGLQRGGSLFGGKTFFEQLIEFITGETAKAISGAESFGNSLGDRVCKGGGVPRGPLIDCADCIRLFPEHETQEACFKGCRETIDKCTRKPGPTSGCPVPGQS